jgi:hypothetical protein
MKRNYKYFASATLSGLFGLLVAFSANAQRHGGGGGSHGGGGGFSGGHSGGGSFSGRSSGGFSGGGYAGRSSGGSFSGRSNSEHYSSPGNTNGGLRSNSSGGSFNRGSAYSRPQGNYASPRGSYSRPQGNYQSQANRGGLRSNSVGGSRYGVSPRSYSNGGGRIAYNNHGSYSYRGSSGIGYRGGVFRGSYNHGRYNSYNPFYGRYNFYSRYYSPRLGFRLSVLPYGYYPFYWGDYQYFYSGGYYYQYDNNNYTVVEPPVGAIMDQLPAGAKSLMIDGEQYYELNGVYYQAVTKDDGNTGYQIAGKDGELSTAASAPQQDDNQSYAQPAPQGNQPNQPVADDGAPIRMGDTFDTLPANCTTVKIDGQKYFVSPDGVYFQEDHDGNHKIYRVAGTPDDQPGK